MWSDLDLGISRVALWTKSAAPVPPVPADEFRNSEALDTISKQSESFQNSYTDKCFPVSKIFSLIIPTNSSLIQ